MRSASTPSSWCLVTATPTASGASRQSCPMPIAGSRCVRSRACFLCTSEPAGVAAPGDRQRRRSNFDGDWSSGRRRWVRQPELLRRWVDAGNVTANPPETMSGGHGGGGGSFIIVSHNILGDDNALKHCDLYSNIPFDVMKWDRRKELICQDIHKWGADIVCLQEVDRYRDLLNNLKREGYAGAFKQRTGNAVDGCAIFWRENTFHLLEEKSIEFKGFGLRDNVAQLCIFEIRILLQSAHTLAEKWGNIPVVLAGDFNSTPESAVYEFLSTSELKVIMHDRKHLSGQNKCHPTPFNLPRFLKHSWTNQELKNATGNWGCTELEHPLKLQSAYATVKGTSRTRGPQGEPLATTYHSKYLGTVDYVWYSVGLSPLRVLDTLPIYNLRKTGGLPSEKIGSDHLALASEFIFTERIN